MFSFPEDTEEDTIEFSKLATLEVVLSKGLIQSVLYSAASRIPGMFSKTPLPGNISCSCFCIFVHCLCGNVFIPRVQVNASSAIIIHLNTGKKHSVVFINLIHAGPGAAVTQAEGSLCTESPEHTQDYLSAWPVERAGLGH